MSPDPLSLESRSERIENDSSSLFSEQEPITGPVTLQEAMARAVKYNLDHRLKMMEKIFHERQLTTATLNLLPDLTAEAGYTGRDNHSGSNSFSLTNGSESLESSTSSDRDLKTFDLSLTWNVLDLGLSWIRAHQQADRVLIQKERRRTVQHALIQDVREAYWKAVSAERLLPRARELGERARRALEDARQAEKDETEPPLASLEYQSDLLESMQTIKLLTRELYTAKTNLATLMNLRPGTKFELDPSSAPELPLDLEFDVKQLERLALLHRPQLREEDYQSRVSHNDVRRAYLRLLPGIEVDGAWNFDSNTFAWEQTWWSWGSTITKNLVEVFTAPWAIEQANAQVDVVETRRLALSIAVMGQVHVSLASYSQFLSEYKTALEFSEVKNSIVDKTEANVRAGSASERDVILAALKALVSEYQRNDVYEKARGAVGRVYVSIGADPLPETVEAHDVKTVAAAIKKTTDGWFKGELALPDMMPRQAKATEETVPAAAPEEPEVARPETPEPPAIEAKEIEAKTIEAKTIEAKAVSEPAPEQDQGPGFLDKVGSWFGVKEAEASVPDPMPEPVEPAAALVEPMVATPTPAVAAPAAEVVKPVAQRIEAPAEPTQPIVPQIQPAAEQAQPAAPEIEPIVEQAQPIIPEIEPVVEQAQPTSPEVEPMEAVVHHKREPLFTQALARQASARSIVPVQAPAPVQAQLPTPVQAPAPAPIAEPAPAAIVPPAPVAASAPVAAPVPVAAQASASSLTPALPVFQPAPAPIAQPVSASAPADLLAADPWYRATAPKPLPTLN